MVKTCLSVLLRQQFVHVWLLINTIFSQNRATTPLERLVHCVPTPVHGWCFGFAKKKYLLHTKRAQIVGAIAPMSTEHRCQPNKGDGGWPISNHSRLHMVHIGLYQPKLPHEMGGSVHNRFHHHHFPPWRGGFIGGRSVS